MIIAIILFTIAIVIAVWCITVSSITRESEWLMFLVFTFIGVTGGAVILYSTPTNNDIKDGKAHYIEQNHIELFNGDTINTYKTYQIVWNQNTK